MFEELKNAENKVVGLKQLLRELEADNVVCVYIAEDAEAHLKEQIRGAIGERDVNVVDAGSKSGLGKVCGIEVSAACAAILKG